MVISFTFGKPRVKAVCLFAPRQRSCSLLHLCGIWALRSRTAPCLAAASAQMSCVLQALGADGFEMAEELLAAVVVQDLGTHAQDLGTGARACVMCMGQ